MGIKITGIDQLQRQLKDASNALQALDGEIASVRFNPDDPASIETAVAQVEEAIDAKIAPYRGNAMVENVVAQMKQKYREQLLERATEARSSQESKSTDMAAPAATTALSQIQNTLTDLRAADYNTYEHHIRKMSRALHAPELDAITRKLTEGIDLDKWLAAGHATEGGMRGSAVLSLPAEQEKELGTIVLLVDHFAGKPGTALNFAMTFYHFGSRRPADDLQKMTRQILVSFVRDYVSYVHSQIPVNASPPEQYEVKAMHLADMIPDADSVLALQPDELGLRILQVLASWPPRTALQLSTFITTTAGSYPTNRRGELQEALSTAWAWLQGQALLIRDPRYGEGVVKLSSRAHKLAQDAMPDARGLTRGERWYGKTAKDSSSDQSPPPNRKVFVVHGHDEAALHATARFLERLGLEAIILREQPDAGRTVIEKFVESADDVGFAVVLLTPDDLGGSAAASAPAARARQNVIFELGYFAGKLGRGRVCLLRKGEVEIPSDLYGVIYTDMDATEGWKRKLARELKEAGFEFDPAKVWS
jgi:Predicted nucleotide-binding protein containing TIR-like domain